MQKLPWVMYFDSLAKSKEKDKRKVSGYSHKLAQLNDETLVLLIEMIKDKLEIKKKDKLLDVGAGAGVITEPLSEYVKEVDALDASRHMLKRIQKEQDK